MQLSFAGKFNIKKISTEIIQECIISYFMEHDLSNLGGGL
jgi:hypothetical protein